MTSTGGEKPRSLAGKAIWLVRNRPGAFLRTARGYMLFQMTRFCWRHDVQITIGKNTRIQRRKSLTVERPSARISIGDHSIVYESSGIGAYGKGLVDIGECAVLGEIRIASRYRVKIGRRFISSWNVFIQDFDPHPVQPEDRGRQIEAICAGFRPRFTAVPYAETFAWDFPGQAIEIGDDVWIGANATVLKGACIGNGCIVATGAVVLSGEYPERSLIAGNPAKVVKTFAT